MPVNHILKVKHPLGNWFTGYPVFPSKSNEVWLFPVNIKNNIVIPQFESLNDSMLLSSNQPMCYYSGASDCDNNPLFEDDLILIDNMFAVIRYGRHKDCNGSFMVGFFIEWVIDPSNPVTTHYRNDFCYWTESETKIKLIKSIHDIQDLKLFIKDYRK